MNKNLLIYIAIIAYINLFASNTNVLNTNNNIFNTDVFIENKGQFDYMIPNGNDIRYGIDHFGAMIFFTKNSVIYKYNFQKYDGHEVHEELEHIKGKEHEDLIKKYSNNLETKYLIATWLNTNPNTQIMTTDKTSNYYSYGSAEQLAYGYKTITYKNIYDGIDIEYKIDGEKGIKYTIYAQPFADLSKVQFQYSGDVKNIDLIYSNIEVIIRNEKLIEEAPLSYYSDKTRLNSKYKLNKNIISFDFPDGYDHSKSIEIDPWVIPITTLTGSPANANRGFDVDFDFDGNLYVFGGGSSGSTATSNQRTAKYTAGGSLLWTFMGSVASISFDLHAGWGYAGNFVVDKSNGKCYMSQGFNPTACDIIRINDLGIYDGWRNIPTSVLNEGWELFYDCRTNAVLVTGGSTASSRIISTLDPVTGAMVTSTFTGITGGFQDILNSVSDRAGNIFVILASSSVPAVNNKIYRLNAGYSTSMWSQFSGYTTFQEADNKRYYTGGNNSNGFNALAVNDTFLYLYDGLNLKAYNKSTGLGIGTPITITGHIAKTQGGITVDDCNHVYVGGNNGNIKVYTFTGTTFTPSGDITIPGYSGRGVYDIRYNQNNNFLYVSGNGFVATIDPSFVCVSTTLADSVERYCNKSASVRILVPDSAATYSYVWQDTLTNVVVRANYDTPNLSDTLRGMIPGRTYLLTVVKNLVCGGIRTTHFISISPDSVIQNTTICIGDTLRVGSRRYTSAGTYRDTILTAYGCDSVVITNLTIGPNFIRTQNINTCPGVPTIVGSRTYTIPGVYRDTFTRSGGLCDSIVITNLTNRPITLHTRTVRICPGGYVVVGTRVYTTPGTYRDTLRNSFGCDSILTSILVLDTVPIFRQSFNLCNGRSIVVGSTTYTTGGVFTTTLSRGGACDSTVITTITLLPSGSRTLTYGICLGDTVRVGARIYTLAGTYRDTLVAYNGCDSFLTININYSAVIPTRTQVVRICAGRAYNYNGHSYTSAGTYRDTVSVPGAGCDSVVTTILLVDPNTTVTQNRRGCAGTIITVGTRTYSVTGTYRDTFIRSSPLCDSIVITNLIVDTLARFNQTITRCTGESYTINGNTYTIPNIYFDTLRRTGTCDSIVITTLIINPISNKIIDTSFCIGESLRVGTSIYLTPGTRYDTLINYLGCDSIVRSNLTIYGISTFSRNISRCFNDSFFVQGAWRRTSGLYYDTLVNIRGCDSVLSTNLNIVSLLTATRNISICLGTSFLCGGANQSTSGSYYDTLTSSIGCDSVLRTNLTVNPILQGIRNINICLGTSYFCGGANQTATGTYYDSLNNASGCDSVLRTNLTVNPILQGIRNINICLGTSYFCGGANQTATGTYYDSLNNASGCDSVLRTNLTVNPILQGIRNINICLGTSYFCGGANQTATGTYYDSLTNASGCDSVLRTNLTVNNPNSYTQTINRCIGQSFFCGGANQTTSGTYYDTLINIYGCDSTLTTNFIINPLPSINAGNDTTLCKNQSATLNASGTGTFIWSNGTITNINNVTPLITTTYVVTITDASSCSNIDSVTVIVNPLPIINVNDTTICAGQNANLFASGGVSYLWNLNNGQFSSDNPTTVSTLNTSAYTVVVTGANGCIDSLQQIVSISPALVDIVPSPDSIIRRSTSLSLFANMLNTTDVIIGWSPASTLTSTTSNPTSGSPTTSQWYYVTTINTNGCIATDSIFIEVIPLDDIIAPTAFSPNGDGVNDIFRLVLSPYLELESFVIVNRWGEEVFNYPKNAAGKGWNGMYKEREQLTGTYVWYAVAKSSLSKDKTYKSGNVTLIR
jgi:gliding motility-associated-like protein